MTYPHPMDDKTGFEEPMTEAYVDIVFDGPPSAESGRFVEVEDPSGHSINFGDWVHREDGYWALRIPAPAALRAPTAGVTEEEIAREIALSYARNDLEPTSEETLVFYREDAKHAARAVLALLPKTTPGVNAEMLAELKWLCEKHGYQSTADVIAKADAELASGHCRGDENPKTPFDL